MTILQCRIYQSRDPINPNPMVAINCVVISPPSKMKDGVNDRSMSDSGEGRRRIPARGDRTNPFSVALMGKLKGGRFCVASTVLPIQPLTEVVVSERTAMRLKPMRQAI